MNNRVFQLNLRLKISAEEAVVLQNYFERKGKTGQIGHILEEETKEMVETLIARATMLEDKK